MSLRLLLLLPMLWGGPLAQNLRYWLELQVSVTVQEGLCVLVPCKFFYPNISSGPLHLFWFQKGVDMNGDPIVATNKPRQKLQERTQGRFFLPGDPQTNNCSLTIRDVNMRDSGTYFFRMEKPFMNYSYLDKMLSLKVTALTHTPDIQILGTLESGCPRNLTCSVPWACEWGTPPSFSWMSAALTSLGPRTHLFSVLTLIPRPQDHGTNLTCQVHFPAAGVTVERTIQLNVSYAPQNTAIQGNSTAFKILQTTSSLHVLEGQVLRLLCAADSNPPAELSWFWRSPALNTIPISSTAILELPRVGTAEEGEFTCQVQHPLGSQNLSFSLSVVYPPQVLGPSCSWEDECLHCSCSSRGQPAPSLHWRLEERLLEGNLSNASFTVTSSSAGPWANSSLSLSRGLSSGLRLSCEAWNVYGAQSTTLLLLPGKPEPRGGIVLGVVGGTGIMVLLSLCFCVIYSVKIHKKKAAQPTHSMDGDVNPVMGSGSGAHQQQFWTDSPSDHSAPDGQEEEELHYAFLRFHNLKLQEQEGASTEYSEIKTHKLSMPLSMQTSPTSFLISHPYSMPIPTASSQISSLHSFSETKENQRRPRSGGNS